MGLTRLLWRAGTRNPHVLVATLPGGTAQRLATEAELRRRGWPQTGSPADADLLVIAGPPTPNATAMLEAVWNTMGAPRARIAIEEVEDVSAALDAGRAGLADPDAQRQRAAERRAARTDTRDAPSDESAPGTPGTPGDLGGHEHGGGHRGSGHGSEDDAGAGRETADSHAHDMPGHGPHGRTDGDGHGTEHGDTRDCAGSAGSEDHGQGGSDHEGHHHGHDHGDQGHGGPDHEDHAQVHHGHDHGHGGPDHEGQGHEGQGHEGHDHEGHGHEGHGHDMGGMMPAGLPMADRGPDRDGLKLDRLHIALGPFLENWPAGLTVHTVLQGDVIQQAHVTTLPAPSATGGGTFWTRPWDLAASGAVVATGDAARRRLAARLDSLGRFLAVAGWDTAATTARVLRDDALAGVPGSTLRPAVSRFGRRVRRSATLSWLTRGLGVLSATRAESAGLPTSAHGDVTDRYRRWIAEATDLSGRLTDPTPLAPGTPLWPGHGEGRGGPSAAALIALLPTLLRGAELAAARLVIASLDPDPDALATVPAEAGR